MITQNETRPLGAAGHNSLGIASPWQGYNNLLAATQAAAIARALPGSIRHGKGFLVRCPVPSHGQGRGDRTPSLSIADSANGKLLVRCFAGCDSRDVLAELRRRGLLDDRPQALRFEPAPVLPVDPEPDAKALALWRRAEPVRGSLGECYLRARGINIELPPTIRFVRDVEYLPRIHFPALIAAAQGPDKRIIAVQLTFLDPDGRGKAHVANKRKTIGALGRGAVRLGPAGDVLGIAEGLETALSARQLHGVPVWACLGASRMQNVAIPAEAGRVMIFADRDGPGREAALKAAARLRLSANVSVRFPPEGCNDWNDALLSKGRAAA
jgi:putative DNA primase/helicase